VRYYNGPVRKQARCRRFLPTRNDLRADDHFGASFALEVMKALPIKQIQTTALMARVNDEASKIHKVSEQSERQKASPQLITNNEYRLDRVSLGGSIKIIKMSIF